MSTYNNSTHFSDNAQDNSKDKKNINKITNVYNKNDELETSPKLVEKEKAKAKATDKEDEILKELGLSTIVKSKRKDLSLSMSESKSEGVESVVSAGGGSEGVEDGNLQLSSQHSSPDLAKADGSVAIQSNESNESNESLTIGNGESTNGSEGGKLTECTSVSGQVKSDEAVCSDMGLFGDLNANFLFGFSQKQVHTVADGAGRKYLVSIEQVGDAAKDATVISSKDDLVGSDKEKDLEGATPAPPNGQGIDVTDDGNNGDNNNNNNNNVTPESGEKVTEFGTGFGLAEYNKLLDEDLGYLKPIKYGTNDPTTATAIATTMMTTGVATTTATTTATTGVGIPFSGSSTYGGWDEHVANNPNNNSIFDEFDNAPTHAASFARAGGEKRVFTQMHDWDDDESDTNDANSDNDENDEDDDDDDVNDDNDNIDEPKAKCARTKHMKNVHG